MQIITESIFDHGTADRIFSIKTQKYIDIDGEKQPIGEPHRIAVSPGDFDIVRVGYRPQER